MAKSKAPKSDTEAATAPVKADAKVSSVQQRADDGRGLASTGKIHEIDLGQAARARTVNLTEAATKALDPKGQLTAAAAPAKSRKGHQRSSSDQRRDNMVDAIFSESKCSYTWNWSTQSPTLTFHDSEDIPGTGEGHHRRSRRRRRRARRGSF